MPLELSIMVDESGSEDSRYYLVTLVFHDQAADIATPIALYEASLRERGLPDIPLHTSPLMNGHDDYEALTLERRKRLLSAFFMMFQHMPVRYRTFAYAKREVGGREALTSRIRRDIVNLIFDELSYFQSYCVVKVYYDGGQGVVTKAIHDAVEYALSKNAIVYRDASPVQYRLLQVADLLCTLELTEIKYQRHEQTSTDEKVFGTHGRFKRLYLRIARRKLL